MERYFPASYALTFVWGLAVLLGMIGLGRLVARAIKEESALQAGWGLHAAWGAALYLFLGGLLALFGLCGATAIVLLIGVGLAALIWTTFRAGLPTRAALAEMPWQNWPAFAVVAVVFAGGLCWQGNVNPADDLAAYYSYCEKLLSTGSFDEPFSWRRLASLGGHTLLQCTVLAHASYANIQAFEKGIAPVILLGLVLGFRRGALARSPLGLFLGLLAVTTPLIRVNTTSHATALTLFVGLFVTLDLAARADSGRRRLFAAAGLIGAALCTLRAQNVAATGLMLAVFFLGSWIKDRRPLRPALIEAGWCGGFLLAALLPWMIMEFRSNGSPLFPLFPGGNNLAFNPQSSNSSLYDRLAFPVNTLLDPKLFPLLLCLMAAPSWRRGVAAHAVSIAAVFTSALLAYSVTLAPDELTILRYVQPLLVGGALVALMMGAISPGRQVATWAFGILFMAVDWTARCHGVWEDYRGISHAQIMSVPFRTPVIADYREAQLLVPEGKRALVCADFPYLFDHRRNDLWIIDLPNATSPAPGLPFQKPPEEMKRYLRGLGIEYLIFVDFEKSHILYNRAVWHKHAVGDVELWKIQAPFFLDFFDTVDRLAATETQLGRVGNITVVQFKP
ncbi:MAG: hypothetical protein P4L99_17505 [Chthoniobacter sp.]|nr:hypothetical protein [Chthoniobacter sp.]